MLTRDDLQNAINAIENTRYLGSDAAHVAAMLGRFRGAVAALQKPAAPALVKHEIRVPPGSESKTGTEG